MTRSWPVAAWRTNALIALVVGDLTAVVVLPIGAAISFAILGAVVGATLAGTWCLQTFPDTVPVPASKRTTLVTQSVLLGAAACPAAASLLIAYGLIGLAALVALAASSPAVRRTFKRDPDGPATDSASHAEQQAIDVAATSVAATGRSLELLSDADLCQQWQSSSIKLTQTAFQLHVAALTNMRATILDELEHRDPEAFAHWLTSGLGAARSMEPFLTASRERSIATAPEDDNEV